MIQDINTPEARVVGRARVGRVGSGQRGRTSNDSDDATKQRCEVSKEEKGSRGVE